MKPLLPTLIINIHLFFTLKTAAWGNLGHRTIALVAEKHMTDAGLRYLRKILGDVDISDAAIWADWYKDTPEGKHTGSWHFINGHDNPPISCVLDLATDCPEGNGCIVTAILNTLKTKSLRTKSTSDVEKAIALKFLLHLYGDLHQPLHTEALARGGNDIPVLFGEKGYNLHFLWDVIFPQTMTSSNESNEVDSAKSWARKLYGRTAMHLIGDNTWAPSNQLFVSEEEKPKGELVKRTESSLDVLRWAKETNRMVCEYVLKDGLDGVIGKELNGSYYTEAIPIIEAQIAKAGRRLGHVINALAEEEMI